MKKMYQTVKEEIQKDNLSDALSELSALVSGAAKSEVLNYQARLNAINRKLRLGIIDVEKGNIEINNIRNSVVQLIIDLEDGKEIARQSPQKSKPFLNNKRIIPIAFFSLVGLFLIFQPREKITGIEGNNNDGNSIVIGNNNTINLPQKERPLQGNLKVSLGLNDEIKMSNAIKAAKEIGLDYKDDLKSTLEASIGYKLIESDEKWDVIPTSYYYDKFEKREIVSCYDVNYFYMMDPPPFIHNPVTFDFKSLNNSDETVFFNKVVFDVERSYVDPKPLITFFEEDGKREFNVIQENWIPVKNMNISYSIYSIDKKDINYNSFRYSKNLNIDGLNPIKVNIEESLQKEGVSLSDLNEVSTHEYDKEKYPDINQSTRKILGALSPKDIEYGSGNPLYVLVVGRLNYSYRNEKGELEKNFIKFEQFVQVCFWSEWGAPGPSSFNYESNLKTDGENYKVTTSVSQYLKPNEIDRFTISLFADKSSIHYLRVKLYNSDSLIYTSKPIKLNILVPRSCMKEPNVDHIE